MCDRPRFCDCPKGFPSVPNSFKESFKDLQAMPKPKKGLKTSKQGKKSGGSQQGKKTGGSSSDAVEKRRLKEAIKSRVAAARVKLQAEGLLLRVHIKEALEPLIGTGDTGVVPYLNDAQEGFAKATGDKIVSKDERGRLPAFDEKSVRVRRQVGK